MKVLLRKSSAAGVMSGGKAGRPEDPIWFGNETTRKERVSHASSEGEEAKERKSSSP